MRNGIIRELETRLKFANEHRGSGRTSRMIDKAGRALENGKAVWVVGGSHKHARTLCDLIGGGNPVGVENAKREFEGRGKISVFVDHSATEVLVSKYIEELKAIGG